MSSRRNRSKSNASIPSAAKIQQMKQKFPDIGADVCEEILRSCDWNVDRAISYLQDEASSSQSSMNNDRQGDWPTLAAGIPPVSNFVRPSGSPRVSVVQMNKLFEDTSKVQPGLPSPSMGDPKSQFKYPPGPPRDLPNLPTGNSTVWNPVLRTSMYSSVEETLREEMKYKTTANVINMITPKPGIKIPKVLIILRGVSGSGKSRLGELILGVNGGGIKCSADDHFIDRLGNYVFKHDELGSAHEKCKIKCERAVAASTTPIIIDNTNTQAWEMVPYAKLGMQFGYIIEILEPNTPWKRSVDTLAKKNTHGVPKSKIRQMLDRWEPVTVDKLELIVMDTADQKFINEVNAARAQNTRQEAAMGNNQGAHSSSGMQSFTIESDLQNKASIAPTNGQTEEFSTWSCFQNPKANSLKHGKNHSSRLPQREVTSNVDVPVLNTAFQDMCSLDGHGNGELANDASTPDSMKTPPGFSQDRRSSFGSNWEAGAGFEPELANLEPEAHRKTPEENANALMNLFPTLPIEGLDHYMKMCGGDLEYCVDLLLEHYEMKGSLEGPRQSQLFKKHNPSLSTSESNIPSSQNSFLNQPRKGGAIEEGRSQSVPPGFTKKIIESSSSNESVTNLDYRDGSCKGSPARTPEPPEPELQEQIDPIDGEDWFDLPLTPDFVTKLTTAYTPLSSLDVGNLPPELFKVRIPPELAFNIFRQFALTWLQKSMDASSEPEHQLGDSDAVFSFDRDPANVEKPRILDTSDDEIIAQVIQMEELTKSPNPNLKAIMALEAKLAARDKIEINQQLAKRQFTMADKLKLDKLRLGFPSLEKSEIEVIYSRCGGSFDDTLKTLQAAHGDKFVGVSDVIEHKSDHQKSQNNGDQMKEVNQAQVYSALNHYPTYVHNKDESDRSATEWRHVAAWHHMSRVDYQAKMMECLRSGVKAGGRADYFLQKINFHGEQMRLANLKASSKILEKSRDQHSDRNTLDLHQLFVQEAVAALEEFLHERATYVNRKMLKKLELKIITGVGNNSHGKLPKIAPAVVAYLNRKHLTFVQLPGNVVITLRYVDTKTILQNATSTNGRN